MQMKKTTIISTILALCIILSASFPVFAAIEPEQQEHCAKILSRLEVMLGDGKGNLMLDRPITRTEFFTLVIRMLAYDLDTEINNISLNFNDADQINNWAVDYIKIALKYELVKGYNDNTLRPNEYVTNAEAQTMILRAMGYGKDIEGDWPQAVFTKSNELGLNNGIHLASDKKLTRGETAVIIYNSLGINLK